MTPFWPKPSLKKEGKAHERPLPFKVGLTGGIGSGKSLVLELLARKGVPVLQTDLLGHRLLREKPFARRIVGHFGTGILSPRGGIDRAALGRRVFDDPAGRRTLNRILHPEIRRRVALWVGEQARRKDPPPLVVVEVPLLFEYGFHHFFDGTLSVSAGKRLRHSRLLRRGLDPQAIRRREGAQWSQARKDRAADRCLRNDGKRTDLQKAVDRWLGRVLRDLSRSRR